MPATVNQPFSPSLTEYQIRVLLVDDQAMVGETVRRMLAPEADIVFHTARTRPRRSPRPWNGRPP